MYNFYKNLFIAFPQFWFGFFNFFSVHNLYDPILNHMYDPVICMLPVIIYGIFDKTFSKAKLIFSPLLYRSGHENYYFRIEKFISGFFQAAGLTLYITVIGLCLIDWGTYENGYSFGYINFGNAIYQSIVVLANLRVLTVSNSFSFQTIMFNIVSQAISFGTWYFLSLRTSSYLYNTFWELLLGKQFWMLLGIIVAIFYLENLAAKLEYIRNESKYIPDFDLKFDANQVNQKGEKKLDVSGVENTMDDKIHQYKEIDGDEDENDMQDEHEEEI